MKKCTFIGGVHGVGKSSLAGVLCVVRSDLGIMVGPDKLTIQCGGGEYEGDKLAVERIERALIDGVNFTQETTLSGEYPKQLCKRAKEAGYYIRLYYVGLDTAEESIRRIRNRVERGGHDIPTKDVNARFSHRFEDVLKILPYCDEATAVTQTVHISGASEVAPCTGQPKGAKVCVKKFWQSFYPVLHFWH